MVFDDSDIVTIRPQRSRNQVMRVLGAVVEKNHRLHADNSQPADPAIINEVLRRLLPLVRHDCLVCIIGDGSGVDAETTRLITQLNAHNDCMFLMVYDPVEARLPRAGRLTASDGGPLARPSTAVVDGCGMSSLQTSSPVWMRLNTSRASNRFRLLPVSTIGPVADQVRRLLGHRGAPRRV